MTTLTVIINFLAGAAFGFVIAGGGHLLAGVFNCGWLLGRLGLSLKNARKEFVKLVGEIK